MDDWSAADGEVPTRSASQLMPMIGTATNEHATVWEQPSVAFSEALKTSNSVLPEPSAFETPYVSLLGSAVPPMLVASGGSPQAPPSPPSYTVPSAPIQGTQY